MSVPSTSPSLLRRIAIYAGFLAAGGALDLITKSLAERHLIEPVVIIPRLFDLHFTVNRGGAFGIFQGMRGLFLTVSLLMLGVVTWFALWGGRRHGQGVTAALGLLAAGIGGNLYDRLFLGGVRDFLDVYVGFAPVQGWLEGVCGTAHWPTFNVADACIVCCGLGLVLFWREPRSG